MSNQYNNTQIYFIENFAVEVHKHTAHITSGHSKYSQFHIIIIHDLWIAF